MTPDEAIEYLMTTVSSNPPTWAVVEATGVLLEACRSHNSVDQHKLLLLLEYKGIIAECAARCLYVQTGRDSLGWNIPKDFLEKFDLDRKSWQEYLNAHPS
jgi:hypothetical protein